MLTGDDLIIDPFLEALRASFFAIDTKNLRHRIWQLNIGSRRTIHERKFGLSKAVLLVDSLPDTVSRESSIARETLGIECEIDVIALWKAMSPTHT